MKIWIVEGVTGEYSDRSEWPVAAFLHEKVAMEFADRANAWLAEYGWSMTQNTRGQRRVGMEIDRYSEDPHPALKEPDPDYPGGRRDPNHPLDPACRLDYTGTEYRAYSVDLHATPEEVADWSIAVKAGA